MVPRFRRYPDINYFGANVWNLKSISLRYAHNKRPLYHNVQARGLPALPSSSCVYSVGADAVLSARNQFHPALHTCVVLLVDFLEARDELHFVRCSDYHGVLTGQSQPLCCKSALLCEWSVCSGRYLYHLDVLFFDTLDHSDCHGF
jgi:hypothetical protein